MTSPHPSLGSPEGAKKRLNLFAPPSDDFAFEKNHRKTLADAKPLWLVGLPRLHNRAQRQLRPRESNRFTGVTIGPLRQGKDRPKASSIGMLWASMRQPRRPQRHQSLGRRNTNYAHGSADNRKSLHRISRTVQALLSSFQM